jgi:diguanylate cyclase (GGDEF)-like protein/PAS domain S-box-containing protein
VGPSDRAQNAPHNEAPGSAGPPREFGMTGDSVDWLRFIVQNSSEIVTVAESDGTLRYASPAFERILGYDPGEALGKNLLDFVHPDDLTRVREETERVTSGGSLGGTNVLEYRFRHKDGSWRWLEGVGTSYQPNAQAVRRIVVSARDITKRKGAEERLRKAEKRYRTLVERAPAVTFIHQQQPGSFSGTAYVSPQIEDVLGYTKEEYASDPQFWKTILHPYDRERVLANDERTSDTGEPFNLEFRMIAKDGRVVWLRESGTLAQDEDGQGQVLHGVMFDITELKSIEGELREAEKRYRTLVEQIPAVTYIVDKAANGPDAPAYTSPQIEKMMGYTPKEWLEGRLWRERLHPEDRERVLAADERFEKEREERFGEEYRLIAKDGSVVWVQEEAVLVKDEVDSPLYWQGVLHDITERKGAEEQLEHRAFHDPLTDLPNRQLFLDRLGHVLVRTERRRGRRAGVLFMDLDGFKIINDSLGHEMGDLLLVAVGERLEGCLRPEDTLARFGGDEFVVLVEDVEGPEQAMRVAERLIDGLKSPFVLEGRELFVRTSMGIALGTSPTKSAEDLLRDADTAMYRAKEESLEYAVFDPHLYERAVWRLELENALQRALEREELVLYYQPIFELGSQEVWGVEALVRWKHPERGLLDPAEFVELAERTGLIGPLGRWVLNEACRRTKGWQQSYPRSAPLRVIVNFSAKQLRHPSCVEDIEEALRESGLGARSLSLDVTESAFVGALEDNALLIQRIENLGVGISIDDFGTGYSSLSYLKRLPANVLKIDKYFVKGIGKDDEDTAIVRMVVELAHTLGMKVIAEGVETNGQVALLEEMGCDMAQGFHFERPLPHEAASEFLLLGR